MSVRALLLAIALVPSLASAQEPETQQPISKALRVMALGDSITVGLGSSHGGGYRVTFWNRMGQAGIEVDMVGGKADGPESFDARHQGYGGSTVYELSSAIPEKMDRYDPDVVLLMIGTNDAKDDFSPPAFQVNFSVLVDRIFSANADARLLIGTIPPGQYGKGERDRKRCNALLKRFVEKRAAAGQAIQLIDIFPLLDTRKDMADPLHPNDSGYEKIGDAFADGLLGMLGSDLAS